MDESERLIELIVDIENKIYQEYPHTTDSFRIKNIVWHLLENGVIVPPLTIDDYVYQYNSILKEIHGYRIEQVTYFGRIFNSTFSYQAICQTNGVVIRFNEDDFGKTVFFTREEAEQALNKIQEDERGYSGSCSI